MDFGFMSVRLVKFFNSAALLQFLKSVITKKAAVTTAGVKILFNSGDKLQRFKIAYNI